MIRKGQMQGVKKGDSISQAAFIALVVWSDHLSPAGWRNFTQSIPLRFFATQPILVRVDDARD
jgi:hypothetical protein